MEFLDILVLLNMHGLRTNRVLLVMNCRHHGRAPTVDRISTDTGERRGGNRAARHRRGNRCGQNYPFESFGNVIPAAEHGLDRTDAQRHIIVGKTIEHLLGCTPHRDEVCPTQLGELLAERRLHDPRRSFDVPDDLLPVQQVGEDHQSLRLRIVFQPVGCYVCQLT